MFLNLLIIMKRVLLFLVTVAIGVTVVQSQSMKAGANLSLPVGDASNAYTFGLQADFAYLFEVNEDFQAGPMASLFYYNGDKIASIKIDDAIFLPIGGHARYSFEQLFVGADLGYAIGISPSGMDGGVLIRPKVGYNLGSITPVLSYSAITRSGTFSSVNLGVEFTF